MIGHAMPEKEPENISLLMQIVPLLFSGFLASVGGAVHYLNRIDRHSLKFSIFHLFVEIITSGFVGVISFMLCDAANFGWAYTAAIVAISGHMGARALFLLEQAMLIPLLRRFGYENGKRETCGEKETD